MRGQTRGMPSTLPDGEPSRPTARCPAARWPRVGARGFGVYVHVPFCASRCGYCDFNTYTAAELGGGGARRRTPTRCWPSSTWPRGCWTAPRRRVRHRVRRRRHADPARRRTSSAGILDGDRHDVRAWPPDAEVTTEANPESVDPASLRALRAAGFTRISLGMQSAAPHVLALLDRRHTPGRAARPPRRGPRGRVRPRQPGPDLRHAGGDGPRTSPASLAAVVGAGVDHVSRVLADRGGRHPAGRPGAPGRAADARRRRGRRPLPGRRAPR